MKKVAVVVPVLCLLLCGCFDWMDGSFVSIEPHRESSSGAYQEMISASSYIELRDALVALVESGTESATIGVEALDQAKVDSNMAMAVRYVTSSNPIGAYAVEDISYEQGTSGGVPAVAVNIAYLHNRAEIRRIKQANGMEEAKDIITGALDQCEAGTVFLVEGYTKTDFPQLIKDYADLHPESVMELPEVTVNIYPETGIDRVVELKFTYQTSRESLRTMQGRVQTVFASARLYVSGDASDYEKFSQLYAFLTNRYSYELETSITPSYSLLCHGVGDSKAHAVCYAAMCRQAGLECTVVTGTRAGEPWFWNIICDEGIYFHVDLIQSSRSGGFRELEDSEMEGYVWDYSAYPPCVKPEEEKAPPMEPEGTQPATQPSAEPTEPQTEPSTQPEVTEPLIDPTEPPTEPDTPTGAESVTEPSGTEGI